MRQLALSWQKFHQNTPHKCHWCGKKDNRLHQMWDHLARVHAWVGEAKRADPFWKEPADPFGERYRPRFQTPLHNPLTSSIATQQVTSLPPAPSPLRPWGCSWGTGCLLHQWAKKQLGIAPFPWLLHYQRDTLRTGRSIQLQLIYTNWPPLPDAAAPSPLSLVSPRSELADGLTSLQPDDITGWWFCLCNGNICIILQKPEECA